MEQLYSIREEWANRISHGLGFLLATAGLVLLCLQATGGTMMVSVIIYGGSLMFLYAASTLYHSVSSDSMRKMFQALDHCAILLLIAGTYTPFTLVSLRGPWGWSLFGAVWGLALSGIVLEFLPLKRKTTYRVVLCLLMGWAVVVAVKPLIAGLPTVGLVLLAVGGLIYSAGVPIYVSRRIPWNHAIWHLFVLAASVAHYFAILFGVCRA